MMINTRASGDGRLRTCGYPSNEGMCFCVVEETKMGTLITEFKDSGEVLDQVLSDTRDAKPALVGYLKGRGVPDFSESGPYEKVRVGARCTKCKGEIARELDLRKAKDIGRVPVIPMFICMNCGSRFYSITDSYLRKLISRKSGLFSAEELRAMEMNEREFVGEVKEYVIRIFASKKITRLQQGK
jgi:hypothetical protein